MKHVQFRVGNPKKRRSKLVTVTARGRSRKEAFANARHFMRTRMKNITEGFFDKQGVFHPIRSAADYSPKRAGEKGTRGRRTAGRSRSKRARRGRQAIS
jgi:hypothetical protein